MTIYAKSAAASILGVGVDAVDMPLALSRILDSLQKHEKGYICVADVHGIMEAQRSPDLRGVYAKATMTVPDGMPLVWVGQMQGLRWMRHVTGPDLMIEMFARPEFSALTHFLYGGDIGVADELRNRLQQRFPTAQIVGTYMPPFRDLSPDEEQAFVARIDALKPDILWVGIGCPRQELFMARYLPLLQTRLIFGVGAAFDYHTGRIRDCSEWVKLAGLQWLHRLVQNPRRLWRRYLRSNPAFLWQITLQFLGLRLTGQYGQQNGRPGAIANAPIQNKPIREKAS
jgi:N-acetylglucosaminyldiphosphoundecaprenol N-acetyl-beta-D-mannosaminyltransferase